MAISEMMKHWQSVKSKYEDCIVFYRLGDFYEMFFEDAIEGAKLLDLTLTGRDCGMEERAPMCGVPYHAAEEYITRLVKLGKKVAICEQLTQPGDQKGLVVRDVVRIVTEGTLIESNSIDDKTNNFIASVYGEGTSAAVAWADITTGEFYVQEIVPFNAEKLIDALVRIAPVEIICSSSVYELGKQLRPVVQGQIPRFSLYRDYAYSYSNAKNKLLKHFKSASLEAFLPGESRLSVIACGSLIEYFSETQRRGQANVERIVVFDESDCLRLDSVALKNLEILKSSRDNKDYGTLVWTVDKTNTAMGSRKLKSILVAPLRNKEKINYRLDAVQELYADAMVREGLIEVLRETCDVERLAGKISNNVITPHDVVSLKKSLELIPSVKLQLAGFTSKAICDVLDNVGDYTELCSILNAAINDDAPTNLTEGKVIKAGYNEELDKQRQLHDNASNLIHAMEQEEKEKTGIRTLKIRYNKIFGYYIEVSNSFKEQVPYNYIRKQTLVNGERYITEELKNFEEQVLTCSEKISALEAELFAKIKNILIENLSAIIRTSKSLAFLDVLVSFATCARKNGYTRPTIVDSDSPFNVVGGRHPVVEAVSRERFIPNDTYMDLDKNRIMIITGPNMAGKSTYMRQIALITILAQCGSFVPAKSAEIPLVDKIFTRVGASDYLILDQSTFMVEMTEVAKILRNATEHSLLILDEVGRGTSTFDGLSIAWAVVEYLAEKIKAKTLFATHYHELSELEGVVDGVTNYKITVKEIDGSIAFLRKVVRGSANKSFGIEVASLAGVPEAVTIRAKKILKKLEKNDLAARAGAERLPTDESEPAESEEVKVSEAETIIKRLNLDNITPLKAFEILASLKEKVGND